MKNLAIDGQFRFSRDNWIVKNEIVDSVPDSRHPQEPFFGAFNAFSHLLDFISNSSNFVLAHLNI